MPVVAGSLLAATFFALSAYQFVSDREPDRRATRAQAVESYERAIANPIKDGGFVIQNGMKPAVAQLGQGTGETAVFQAVGWVDSLVKVRNEIKAVPVPAELEEAAAHLDTALDLYRQAAETLGAAAIAAGEARMTLLDRAVANAKLADETYDRAAAVVQRARRSAGLPPSTLFPGA